MNSLHGVKPNIVDGSKNKLAILVLFTAAFGISSSSFAQSQPGIEDYSPAALAKARQTHAALERNVNAAVSCRSTNRCNPQGVAQQFNNTDNQRINILANQCIHWLVNSFSDTRADLERWRTGPAAACSLQEVVTRYQGVLPAGSPAHQDVLSLKKHLEQFVQPLVIRHFEKSLAATFSVEQPRMDQTQYPWQQFANHTEKYLGWPYMSDRMPTPFLQARIDALKGADRQRDAINDQRSAERHAALQARQQAERERQQREQQMTAGEAFGAIFADTLAGASAYVRANEPDLPIIPGKVAFQGIVFGDTSAEEALVMKRRYVQRIHDNNKNLLELVGGGIRGVTEAPVRTASDGRTKIHCWSFNGPRGGRSIKDCLYIADGKAVGGRFAFGVDDGFLLKYLDQQGLRRTLSYDSKQLGFSGFHNRYVKGNMTAHYTRHSMYVEHRSGPRVRDNDAEAFWESDFCFFPTVLKAALNDELSCTRKPRA